MMIANKIKAFIDSILTRTPGAPTTLSLMPYANLTARIISDVRLAFESCSM